MSVWKLNNIINLQLTIVLSFEYRLNNYASAKFNETMRKNLKNRALIKLKGFSK